MDREFSDFIASVLDKTDIVSLISRYVKLDRKGNTHWACCPFHHESQPSFAVNADRQFFHCFGCKESGNAISFLMKVENIEFIDALKMLAEQAGMEMPQRKGGYSEQIDKKQRETLYALMKDAARHYHDNLSDPKAKKFRDYLDERKLPQSMVTRFGLGASLGFTEMLNYLQSKGYTYEQMHAAGIAESKDGRKYDVFGDRLMYPIIDNMGRVVAFGGRTLEKDAHFAKYRNSSDTDIFKKSNVIYGINILKKVKSQRHIDYIIMAEGYMDVIALHKAGFDTAVASMGTALTSGQARQLKLYSDLVYISYDGDTAGQKGMLRGLDILRETGIIVKVVRLPDGLDPDDVIKRGGKEAYQKLLDEAIPLTAYKIETLLAKYDIKDPDQKAIFAIEATKVITALNNPIEQEQYFKYVSDRTGFSIEALKKQANFTTAPPQKERVNTEETAVEYDPSLRFFLASIIQARDYVDYDKDVSGAMPDEFSRRLYAFCKKAGMDAPKMYEDEFGHTYDDIINELFDYNFLDSDGRSKFTDVENKLYLRVLSNERDMLKGQTDEASLRRLQDIVMEMAKISQQKA